MYYGNWWKNILQGCELCVSYDQGLANCHHKKSKKGSLCNFESCPKIPKEDKERIY